MTQSREPIAVVVDRSFGERLKELVVRAHTWVCASEVNQQAVRSVWSEGNSQGATLFTAADRSNAETVFLNAFSEIAEHHPDWYTMEVFGVTWTKRIAKRLSETGAIQIQDRSDGFMVMRCLNIVDEAGGQEGSVPDSARVV